jgi:hypothetical protein
MNSKHLEYLPKAKNKINHTDEVWHDDDGLDIGERAMKLDGSKLQYLFYFLFLC